MKFITLSFLVLLGTSTSFANTFEWKGGYRVEYINLEKPSLSATGSSKEYMLNHLYLAPQIIGTDGFNIITRFDLTSAAQNSEYSQLGLIWGNTNGSGDQSAVADPATSGVEQLSMTQFYLQINQEHGQIILGRSPIEFGLGMTYSAGTGAFDHWYNTRDQAAYKFFVGDWFIMPIISKAGDQSPQTGGGMNSLGFMVEYENPDTRSKIGIFQDTRKGSEGSNDLDDSYGTGAGPGLATVAGGYDIQRTNILFGRGWDSFNLKFEAGFVTGATGLTIGGDKVDLNSYGFALEMDFPKSDSKWLWSGKVGLASGDDPETSTYEAFHFNPNYNVGMLLFNQRMGQSDFLTSAPVRQRSVGIENAFDDEVVSNTMFIAPSVNYTWSEKSDLRTTLIYAQLLNSQQNSLSSAKDLGLELDISYIYKPTDRLQWINEVGLLFPGSAWKYGPSGAEYDNSFSYGFASKAAISF